MGRPDDAPRGCSRTVGPPNVSVLQPETGRLRPAVVQVKRHPYRPCHDLVAACHDRGIRVVAHSPLSAPGLLDEPVLETVGEDQELSPAGVVLAWNATRDVVPIPSSTTPRHVVSNLAAIAERLPPSAMERVDALRAPDFERRG